MSRKKLLLVEGPNDKHVILAIQGRFPTRLLDKDDIFDCGNDGKILESLPVRINQSDLEHLGVVMDADVDVAKRWKKLRSILEKGGYQNVPENPATTGTVILPPAKSLLPRIGIWLMPDNTTKGILEDFLKFLIPNGCPLLTFAEETTGKLPEIRFPEVARTKALIHTWLAWQEDPGRPLGQSITARYFDTDAGEAKTFIAWMESLFS